MARNPSQSGLSAPMYGGFDAPYKSEEVASFPAPAENKFFAGEGATIGDLKTGFLDPNISENPAYEPKNYKDRLTVERSSDLDEDGDGVSDDYRFREKDRVTTGLFTRPHIPTER